MPSSRPGRTAAALVALTLAAGCAHTPPATTPKANSRAERNLAADLDRIFGAPVMQHALWGVQVKSLASGRILYARNAATLLMPASNMKIVTVAAAAETLGWDYRFKTTLEAAGRIDGGALEGDLIVRGTGDPTINARGNRAEAVFDEWAGALKAAGITRITGSIIGDDDAFDDVGLGQGWSWDYLQDGYAAPVGALELNENVATLHVRPGPNPGEPLFLELTDGSGFRIVNRTTTAPPQSRTAVQFERHASVLDGAVLEVTGALAADAPPISRNVAVVNPTYFFVRVLRAALAARGIEVTDFTADIDDRTKPGDAAPRRLIAETLSPPLRDIATVTMKVSHNLYAETLLKATGTASGQVGSAASGRDVARGIFTAWNIPPGTYVQADGSGLSRYDYVTAGMIVTILERLHGDPRHRDAFVATLPIAGKDGTISTRLRATRAEANAVAKTGSISNVRSLSGYVRTRDGELLAFSMLANNFTIPAATVNWIADLAVETLANHTRR